MPPIEAYEIGPEGTHIAVSTGAAPTSPADQGDASGSAGSGAPADNGAPAPPQSTPPPDQGLAAPDAGEGDDGDIPETATVDYVAKRINRLNARYRSEQRAREADRQAAQERLAQQQGQIEALTRMLQGAAPDMGQAPSPPAGPPQAEQYASHDEYVLAAARYGAQQELQVRDQQTQQQRQQEQEQQMQRALLEREAAFQQAHPDFHDVVRQGLAGKVAPHVQQALMLLPDGPALAYTLAQQQDLVRHLNTLPPPLVFAELGRLMPGQVLPGGNGSAPAGTPPATNGSAPSSPPQVLPEPMRPVGGNGSAPPPAFRDGMSLAEYRQMRARSQGR
jgi:hypothetical protein